MPVVRGHGPQTVNDVLDGDVGEGVWEAGSGGDGADGTGAAGAIGGRGRGAGGGQLKRFLSRGERVGHHAGTREGCSAWAKRADLGGLGAPLCARDRRGMIGCNRRCAYKSLYKAQTVHCLHSLSTWSPAYCSSG